LDLSVLNHNLSKEIISGFSWFWKLYWKLPDFPQC
jgi:hypothetical protein